MTEQEEQKKKMHERKRDFLLLKAQAQAHKENGNVPSVMNCLVQMAKLGWEGIITSEVMFAASVNIAEKARNSEVLKELDLDGLKDDGGIIEIKKKVGAFEREMLEAVGEEVPDD